MNLNAEQERAATHKEGSLIIVAGAGTGKTKTLTTRILNLIASGVAPEKILAVTFTNKAAKEMKERISHHLPHNTAMPVVGTFHSFGLMIIKKYGTRVGIARDFTILDRDDQNKLLEQGIKAIGLDTEQWSARKFRERISWLRNSGMTAEELESNAMSDLDRFCAKVWKHYNTAKNKQQVLDFDDLLEIPVRLLQTDETVRTALQNSYDYIHIDEYQDTNKIQDELVEILARQHGNVCVVGDTDQTIYTWRGALIHNMLNFHKKFPNTELVTLTHNYRSSDIIIAAGNALISKNKSRIPKDLIATKQSTEKIEVYRAMSEGDEALWVAEQLAERNRNGIPWSEMCILYRSHYLSRAIEEALMRAGISYSVIGTKFFDRREIRDMMSWLRAAYNPLNLSDMKRVVDFPKRGIGAVAWANICAGEASKLKGAAANGWENIQTILREIKSKADSNIPVSELVLYTAKASGIYGTLEAGDDEDRERLYNIQELVSYAKSFDEDYNEPGEALQSFMERIALLSDQDALDSSNEGVVKLMTIHAAKGLEFDTVAIVGLEQGVFPTENDDTLDPEEERRLMYVAVTRAKSKLLLSWSMMRRIFGSTMVQTPSQFISDIPAELIAAEKVEKKSAAKGLLDWDLPIVEWD